METLYFKMIFQKSPQGKMMIMAVVPDNFICEGLPTIFEVQAFLMPPTIYTGTYPQIKILPESIKDVTEQFKGYGANGIFTEADWYNKTIKQTDNLGIGIK